VDKVLEAGQAELDEAQNGMKILFSNHWKHQHIIVLGCEWGDYFGNYFEFTVLNFGIRFRWDLKRITTGTGVFTKMGRNHADI